MHSKAGGFMLYGKLCVDFFSTSELLYPDMKIRLRLIRARLNSTMISNNPNVSPRIVDCSLYTRHIALKFDYHKKRMDLLAYTPVEFNYLETLARTFIIPLDKISSSRKKFQQCSSSSNCYCNEYKLCIHWIARWNFIVVSTVLSKTK